MHIIRLAAIGALIVVSVSGSGCQAKEDSGIEGPVEVVYAVRDTTVLHAFLFSPSPRPGQPSAAIVLFHGGGWFMGEAQWAFPTAKHFAGMGMVGVAAQYRLSDQKTITPLEAMADARSVIRWIRSHADSLSVDPDRIAAYGWSAGAHLAACAAVFDDADSGSQVSCSPNALILHSPAVSVIGDGWFRRLLLGRADVRDVSPDEHVRPGLPPALILQGDVDTVTPLAFVERFWRRMHEAGNRCELEVYEGFGHLFTPMSVPDNERPQPDKKIVAEAMSRAEEFLRSLGFLR